MEEARGTLYESSGWFEFERVREGEYVEAHEDVRCHGISLRERRRQTSLCDI